FTFVFEGCLARPQHLADRVPRNLEVPRNLPDRLAFDEVLAPYPRNRFHDQHPLTTRFRIKAGSLLRPHFRGSFLDADPPAQGVKIARRLTTWKRPSAYRTVCICSRRGRAPASRSNTACQ